MLEHYLYRSPKQRGEGLRGKQVDKVERSIVARINVDALIKAAPERFRRTLQLALTPAAPSISRRQRGTEEGVAARAAATAGPDPIFCEAPDAAEAEKRRAQRGVPRPTVSKTVADVLRNLRDESGMYTTLPADQVDAEEVADAHGNKWRWHADANCFFVEKSDGKTLRIICDARAANALMAPGSFIMQLFSICRTSFTSSAICRARARRGTPSAATSGTSSIRSRCRSATPGSSASAARPTRKGARRARRCSCRGPCRWAGNTRRRWRRR